MTPARRRGAIPARTCVPRWTRIRALRRLVARPAGISAAALIACAAPSVFDAIIRYADDCDERRT